jgi:hypothetical protein
MYLEISSEDYHINCTYEEAIIYCLRLVIDGKTGWRIPTYSEYIRYIIISNGWFLDKTNIPILI